MKKSYMKKSLTKTLNLLIVAIGITGLESAIAQTAHDDEITYSKDIANIIFEKCASCHNPDGIGPMSLLNYEEVRPWAPLISYCLLYTSPSPRDGLLSRMQSSA